MIPQVKSSEYGKRAKKVKDTLNDAAADVRETWETSQVSLVFSGFLRCVCERTNIQMFLIISMLRIHGYTKLVLFTILCLVISSFSRPNKYMVTN